MGEWNEKFGKPLCNNWLATYVWNNGDKIDNIHNVFEEGNFARTCAKSNDELKREPNLV